MEMTSLRLLHHSMISIGSEMQQFQIRAGAASFDCLFSTRDEPSFVLTLTSRGAAPKFFRFSVEKGYRIKDYLGDMYGDLLSVLRTDGTSGKRLIPKEFLEQLNREIPHVATSKGNPKPPDIVRLRPDIIEDRDRPYFDTWIYWNTKIVPGPSPDNLKKTHLLLGKEAANHSREQKASTRWSATDTGRTWQSEMRRRERSK